MATPKIGQLQVWWVPQVPMQAFTVDVDTLLEGKKLLDVLTAYDLFQLHHRVKPDFCNAGGLRVWDPESDGNGTPGWTDVDEDEDEPSGYWLPDYILAARGED